MWCRPLRSHQKTIRIRIRKFRYICRCALQLQAPAFYSCRHIKLATPLLRRNCRRLGNSLPLIDAEDGGSGSHGVLSVLRLELNKQGLNTRLIPCRPATNQDLPWQSQSCHTPVCLVLPLSSSIAIIVIVIHHAPPRVISVLFLNIGLPQSPGLAVLPSFVDPAPSDLCSILIAACCFFLCFPSRLVHPVPWCTYESTNRGRSRVTSTRGM